MEIIDIVKAKVPADISEDLIKISIAEVRQVVLTFCNRTDIPKELNFVVANMVVELINGNLQDGDEANNGPVESIKEGDTQITYSGAKSTKSQDSAESILHNYKNQLLKYRKLKW